MRKVSSWKLMTKAYKISAPISRNFEYSHLCLIALPFISTRSYSIQAVPTVSIEIEDIGAITEQEPLHL